MCGGGGGTFQFEIQCQFQCDFKWGVPNFFLVPNPVSVLMPLPLGRVPKIFFFQFQICCQFQCHFRWGGPKIFFFQKLFSFQKFFTQYSPKKFRVESNQFEISWKTKFNLIQDNSFTLMCGKLTPLTQPRNKS